MRTITKDDIVDEIVVCAYCLCETDFTCCGENHLEKAYVLADDIVLQNEVIVNETKQYTLF